MDLISTLAGSMMEGYFPAGWGPGEDRSSSCPASRRPGRAAAVVGTRTSSRSPAPRSRTSTTFMGHEIALEVLRARGAGPVHRLHPAGRADGHVPLGGLLPAANGTCPATTSTASTWTNGPTLTATRCPRTTPAPFSSRWSRRFYGPPGVADRAGPGSAIFALKNELPHLRRTDRRPEEGRG